MKKIQQKLENTQKQMKTKMQHTKIYRLQRIDKTFKYIENRKDNESEM